MSDHIWDSPADYDPMKDGPPYLPRLKTAMRRVSQDMAVVQAVLLENILKDYAGIKGAEVSAVLVYLRSLAWLHQTHHWQTNGSSFYGDHQLFDRLYTGVQTEVDSTAEKAVGLGLTLLVDANMQASQMARVLRHFSCAESTGYDATGMVAVSYRAELFFSFFLQMVYLKLEAEQKLSLGLDNFLQGLADKHEEHMYLLKQRMSIRQASWKTADKKV